MGATSSMVMGKSSWPWIASSDVPESVMGDLTHDFDISEYACRCGCGAGLGAGDLHPMLVAMVQEARTALGEGITLTSAARCPAHNQAVGGAENSAHLTVVGELPCRAVDIAVPDIGYRARLRDSLKRAGFRRFGTAQTFLHVDVGDAWDEAMYPPDVEWVYQGAL